MEAAKQLAWLVWRATDWPACWLGGKAQARGILATREESRQRRDAQKTCRPEREPLGDQAAQDRSEWPVSGCHRCSRQEERFPPVYLDVPDADGFCFSQDFQSLSVGIGSALGAAVARPDRLVVYTVGDGGLMMCLGDLETAVRYDLPLLAVVYNDAAYGAEVHLLENLGWPTGHAFFGETDFAAVARSLGGAGCTVRALGDLDQLAGWLAAPSGLMVADCKVNRS